MKYKISFFLFFIAFFASSQEKEKQSTLIKKIEEYVLYNNKDSATLLLKKVQNSSYSEILNKINEKEVVNYSEYNTYLNKVSNRFSVNYKDVSNFIETRVKTPLSKSVINADYVTLKWNQVSKLRDEVSLEEATKVHDALEAYINQFDASNSEVLRLKTKITTHPIVMLNIKKDMQGKALCLNSLAVAKQLGDLQLEIIFLYHLTDYLILEGKLDEYIETCEKALVIEVENNIESPYHFAIVTNLIDAYIYKGSANNRIQKLIDGIYNDEDYKLYSYDLYMYFLSTLKKDKAAVKQILTKFNVNSVLELAEKFKEEAKDLNALDYERLTGYTAKALAAFGYYNEAILYKTHQMEMVKNIYSKDLSKTLAKYEKELAVREKEIEVENQKEKNRIYIFITALITVFLIISLFVIRKIRRQSRELNSKNKIISQNLKEKELLVKEVHHRVKNNFQIVSSLLELQTRGIEDEKALALAKEGKNRVRSMALIHQKLYQNEDGLVDFDEYLELLVREIHAIYASDTKIETSIVSKNKKFDVDTAIPLGLIINEIITNAYKYAFHPNKENSLTIILEKENEVYYKLTVKDNGPGFPEDVDAKKAKSLGLRLVNRLVKQLHGELVIENKNGALFKILFKDENARQTVN